MTFFFFQIRVCFHLDDTVFLVFGARVAQLKEHPERGVYVRDLSMHSAHSVAECERIIEHGWRKRAVGYTLMNKDSSRSHSIFTIHLEICSTGGNKGVPHTQITDCISKRYYRRQQLLFSQEVYSAANCST